MEVLSHINKRAKLNKSIKLPFDALLQQFTDEKLSAMVKNFTIIYLEMCVDRMTVDETAKHIASFLKGISRRPEPQRITILHMILPVRIFWEVSLINVLMRIYVDRRYQNGIWVLRNKKGHAKVSLGSTAILKILQSCYGSFWISCCISRPRQIAHRQNKAHQYILDWARRLSTMSPIRAKLAGHIRALRQQR